MSLVPGLPHIRHATHDTLPLGHRNPGGPTCRHLFAPLPSLSLPPSLLLPSVFARGRLDLSHCRFARPPESLRLTLASAHLAGGLPAGHLGPPAAHPLPSLNLPIVDPPHNPRPGPARSCAPCSATRLVPSPPCASIEELPSPTDPLNACRARWRHAPRHPSPCLSPPLPPPVPPNSCMHRRLNTGTLLLTRRPRPSDAVAPAPKPCSLLPLLCLLAPASAAPHIRTWPHPLCAGHARPPIRDGEPIEDLCRTIKANPHTGMQPVMQQQCPLGPSFSLASLS